MSAVDIPIIVDISAESHYRSTEITEPHQSHATAAPPASRTFANMFASVSAISLARSHPN